MSRNEDISSFLSVLEDVWQENPDLTFGELVKKSCNNNIDYEKEVKERNFYVPDSPEKIDLMLSESAIFEQKMGNLSIEEWKDGVQSVGRMNI